MKKSLLIRPTKFKIAGLVIVTAVSTAVSGCAPMVVGGAASVGYVALQERDSKVVIKDTKIKTHIKDRLTNINYRYLTQAEITVLEGEVLVTGVVANKNNAEEIAKVIRDTPDVKNIYMHLFTNGEYPASQYAKDSWMSAQFKGRLLGAKDVYSINYLSTVVNNNVYIMGISGSASELERVVHLARTTKNVKRVHNYIKVHGNKSTQ